MEKKKEGVLISYFKWFYNKWYFWFIVILRSVSAVVYNYINSFIGYMGVFFAILIETIILFFLIYGLSRLKKNIFKRWYFWIVVIILSSISLIGYILRISDSNILTLLWTSFIWSVIAYLMLFGIKRLIKGKKKK